MPYTSKEIIEIITSITTSSVVIIAAISSLLANVRVKYLTAYATTADQQTHKKLDDIQEITNGAQAILRKDLADASIKVEKLYAVITELMAGMEPSDKTTEIVSKITEDVFNTKSN